MEMPPIQYVTTADGFRLAYIDCGDGEPVVFVPPVMHHLQLAWEEEGRAQWLQGLASRYRLITYDARGSGLSTRGIPLDFTMADKVVDLEAIAESARLDRFALFVVGSECHTAVRFALRHPDRVVALVMISCGLDSSPWSAAMVRDLASEDWDTFFFVLLRGGQSYEETQRMVEDMKRRVNQDDFATIARAFRSSSIEADLAQLQMPVLVLHPREVKSPSYEDCADVAALIPNARLAMIEGGRPGGIIYGTSGDSSSDLPIVCEFLEGASWATKAGSDAKNRSRKNVNPAQVLSRRQLEVLRMVAEGNKNSEIADALVLSQRTVERHLTDIYQRIDARNRAEAVAYWLRNGPVTD